MNLLTLAQAGFPEAMHGLTLTHYLFVSAVMFTLGQKLAAAS